MEEKYEDFVGIYDESVPLELCDEFVKNYEEAKKNSTIIDLTKINATQIQDQQTPIVKRDEVAVVTPLTSTIYPRPPVNAYFEFLQKCFMRYVERYSVTFSGLIYNDIFKIHKVRKSEGFHAWHYERASGEVLDRMLAYMTYLEVPKRGGETEFLHQSLRVDPVVGRTLIWPAGFTHMHRGNPPLDGEKMYITGWFTVGKLPMNEEGSK